MIFLYIPEKSKISFFLHYFVMSASFCLVFFLFTHFAHLKPMWIEEVSELECDLAAILYLLQYDLSQAKDPFSEYN